jgi:capsular exopolysaccharide synthesis family protein
VGYFAMSLVKPEYEAQATLWVQGGGGGQGTVDAGPMQSSQLLQSSAWIDLLRSFAVLDYVVIEERLYLHAGRPEDRPLLEGLTLGPRFAPGDYRVWADHARRSYVLETRGGNAVERGEFGDSVAASVGLSWQPDLTAFPEDRPVNFTVAVPRDEAVNLGERLRTQIDRTGNFLRLELRGEDPQRTASVLNALADRHVEMAAELKRTKVDTLVSILQSQLRSAERQLRDVELALEDFKVATATLPAERSTPIAPGTQMTTNPVFNRFFNMRVTLEQIRESQDVLRRAISGQDGPVVEALASVGAVQQSAELQRALDDLTEARADLRALESRYTAEHQAVVRARNVVSTLEDRTIPGLVNALLAELETREAELEETLASASDELREIPPRAIEEARLERQVGIAGQLYTTLEQRYQEASLASASSVPDIRILDEAAVPRRPVQDEQIMVLLAAILGALGLGIAGAILRDRLDPRIRYPQEISRRMGLDILGMVPRLPNRKQGQEQLTQVQEAFRTIRLNVQHAFGTAGPITFTVSSPGPGDGKTFVASNLAVAFAKHGNRVILVDGDIRRGWLHDLMKVDRKPGLTDYLDGKIGRQKLIRETRFKRLDVIPSGKRIRYGPELLGSEDMRELLLGLRADYDVVIVDSPPMGAGVDPFALSTMTGHLLIVLRSGATDRELASSKLELLDRLPIRVLGAIMNDVPAGKEYGYSYYSYSYVSGYEAVDEVEEEPALEEGKKKPLQVGGGGQ